MESSDSLLIGTDDSFLASLLQADTKEAHLDAVAQSMLASLSALSPETLEDPKFLDSLSLASRLFMQCLEGTETSLGDSSSLSSPKDLETRINLWQNSLEPWHEYLKKLKNLGTVPYKCLEKLLDSLPCIIQAVFSHCKRSSDLYGRKFEELRSQLTSLCRRSGVVLGDLFSVIDSSVNFNGQVESERNVLKTVLEKIGDIAVVTDGVDLKTLMNTWKVFAKLAVVHESLVKKSSSTDVVTSRYTDIARDIQNLLLVSLQDRQDTNYERAIKLAGFLLKILARLCALYRGYCGNKVSHSLVQLLAKLYRYMPPFPSHLFVVPDHSNVSRYSETHIVPAATELLSILLGEPEFSKAFFLYGKSELEDPICYHLVTLRIGEELIETKMADFSLWQQKDENIVDLSLSNVNRCCADLLVDQVRVPARNNSIFGSAKELGVYEMSLKLLCHFVAGVSCHDFSLVETSLLKHLVGGEFWSSLLSCDLWTFLATVSSLELCSAYVSYFLEIRKLLRPRNNCHEFGMMSHLLGRLWKILPEEVRESIFREIEDSDDKRFLDPGRKSARQLATGNNELGRIFQDFCRSPSATNWNRLISTLRSIGTLPKDGIPCDMVAIRDIWNFTATRIPRSEGIARQMLLELLSLLLLCSAPDSRGNSQNDSQAASVYRNMLEIVDHVPPEYRLKINVFLRENLVARINDSGQESLAAISSLFCRLIDDDDFWVRQEYFETYNEYMVQMASANLFDALSIGINRSPRVCKQMQLYLSNQKIHNFSKHSSTENYLRNLSISTRNDLGKWHKCYQPDSGSQPEEKRARLECSNLDERVDHVCNEIQFIIERKNELSDSSIDKLRLNLLKFFQNGF